MNPDSETSATEDILDPSSRLLQVLNDQRLADIDECVAEQGTKVWINKNVDPKQLVNPVVDFEDVESITCLTFASLVNDFRTVRQLVEAGSDVRATDWTGSTPLHYACASRVEAQAKVEYMLQRDASLVNATNYSENAVLDSKDDETLPCRLLLGVGETLPRYSTPLHVATEHNQTECIKTLVNDGQSPVNATDGDGWTTLRLASVFGNAEAAEVLVQRPDCRVNATDRWGRSGLHLAAENGHTEAVKVLAEHPNCRVNATDSDGSTALHTAAWAGHAEAVKVLVSHPRCDVSIIDMWGDTAAVEARREGHDDIAALIEAKSKGKR